MSWRATAVLAVALSLFLAAACNGDNAPADSPSPSATLTASPTPTPSPTPSATPSAQVVPPSRDLIDLARRYRGLPADAPRLARQTPLNQQVGDSETFTLLDLDGPALYEVRATVQTVTEHAYFFVQDGVGFSQSNLQRVASDFESIVYPGVTAAFGREWSPGVDSDPRITILHADLRGAGGYFSSSDEFPRAVVGRSNERELLYLESPVLASPGAAYNHLVAHELQHMVHFNADADEDSWVNEGLSQTAAGMLVGPSSWINTFLARPDVQLNFWPVIGDTIPHYAASELFFSYVLDHYGGRENGSQLLGQPGDSIAGVEAFLQPHGKTFLDVFGDWLVANYLDLNEGPYSHPSLSASVPANGASPGSRGDRDVHQFAGDYLEIDAAGTFVFDGADTVSLPPPAPPAGGAAWWSNRGDMIDSRLTREVDLTGVASATLQYSAWFEIERGWDYAYVAASTDGGATWRALPGQQTTDYDPIEVAYGPGYTGESGGWVEETVALGEFAGRKVLVRFEYVTDDSTNLGGLAVAGMRVPELGSRGDLNDAIGWESEGFMRVDGPLPQKFLVQVIDRSGASPQVSRLDLDAANRGQVALPGPATIVIAGVTDLTTEVATYGWSVSPP